jgi:hypothetical protein
MVRLYLYNNHHSTSYIHYQRCKHCYLIIVTHSVRNYPFIVFLFFYILFLFINFFSDYFKFKKAETSFVSPPFLLGTYSHLFFTIVYNRHKSSHIDLISFLMHLILCTFDICFLAPSAPLCVKQPTRFQISWRGGLGYIRQVFPRKLQQT